MCAPESLPLHCSNINGRVKRLFHDLRQMFTLFVCQTPSLAAWPRPLIDYSQRIPSFGAPQPKPKIGLWHFIHSLDSDSRSSRRSPSERHSSIFLFSFCQSWLKHRRRRGGGGGGGGGVRDERRDVRRIRNRARFFRSS